jgi:ABC-2 type transport system ATP-binding protein
VIDVSHLTKRYGAHLAVDDLSFRIERGEVAGFLGPNGAGKSTTLRMIVGFLGMTAGKVEIAGFDVVEQGDEARRRIGYMPENVPLYPEMRVVEYLEHRAELKRVPRATRRAYVLEAMEKARVTDVATRLIGTLSKGYRQRVGLADALVAKPPIVVLDEPTSGLDPNQIRDVRRVLAELAREHTVLLSTHILREVEATCSRAVVIAKGRLVAEGSIDALRRMRTGRTLEILVRGAPDVELLRGAAPAVASIEVAEAGDENKTLRIAFAEEADDASRGEATEALVAACVRQGLGVREAKRPTTSLEDVFSALTQSAGAGDASDSANPLGRRELSRGAP